VKSEREHRDLLSGIIFLSIFIFQFSICSAKNDSIYNGTQVKVDILSPVLISGLNNWQVQHYEAAVNVRLAKRFYPTIEAGYATPGGFFRVGADINPLKKNPESPHALLVGLRIGSGYQALKADCWGEIVAGCQVEIAKVNKTAFYMGWMGRFKFLFTRNTEDKDGNAYPTYIPGYGERDNIGWGANYYLGWRF
jgi:hypothetical protein